MDSLPSPSSSPPFPSRKKQKKLTVGRTQQCGFRSRACPGEVILKRSFAFCNWTQRPDTAMTPARWTLEQHGRALPLARQVVHSPRIYHHRSPALCGNASGEMTAGSSSRGGDPPPPPNVRVCVFWHKPTELAHSFIILLLASVSVFTALSTVFHSLNSPRALI